MNRELSLCGYFKYAVPLQPRPPKLRLDGRLDEWQPRNLLPDFTAIDGKPGFCDVYAGWDKAGLHIAYEVTGKKTPAGFKGDGLRVWIDTRDTRDIHRGTRYCHWYTVEPRKGGAPDVVQRQVTWQAEEQFKADASLIKVGCCMGVSGYGMEVFYPAKVLNGYDPSQNARLGLFVQVVDHDHGEQFWPVPAPLPFWQDPSLWAAVELVG